MTIQFSNNEDAALKLELYRNSYVFHIGQDKELNCLYMCVTSRLYWDKMKTMDNQPYPYLNVALKDIGLKELMENTYRINGNNIDQWILYFESLGMINDPEFVSFISKDEDSEIQYTNGEDLSLKSALERNQYVFHVFVGDTGGLQIAITSLRYWQKYSVMDDGGSLLKDELFDIGFLEYMENTYEIGSENKDRPQDAESWISYFESLGMIHDPKFVELFAAEDVAQIDNQMHAVFHIMDSTPQTTPTKVIDSFSGEYEFLSNFYSVEQKSQIAWVEEDDGDTVVNTEFRTFPSVEHAFQASKTLSREDQEEITKAMTAGQAKRLGRRVTLIPNWDSKRIDVMERLLEDKFGQNFRLKIKLLLTGDAELVEGNTWKDQFWGKTEDGVGENHLGRLLMKVRNRICRDEGDVLDLVKHKLVDVGLDFVGEWISLEKTNGGKD